MARKNIPIQKLEEYTNIGVMLFQLDNNYEELLNLEATSMNIHRDDYYIFLVLDKCDADITIDFKDFRIKDQSIFYTVPGQVQSNFPEFSKLKGWVAAIEPNLIDEFYRTILTDNLLNHRSISIGRPKFDNITQCLSTIDQEITNLKNTAIHRRIIISLLDVLVGTFAEVYQEQQAAHINLNSRPFLITSEFRKLLSENFKTMKSPSQYAEALHISVSYLNEVVKNITGSPVSHWIIQENMLEAKRLLYYSNMNVKEIAFALGYEDHTYFSRLFSNVNGESPLSFRRAHRE